MAMATVIEKAPISVSDGYLISIRTPSLQSSEMWSIHWSARDVASRFFPLLDAAERHVGLPARLDRIQVPLTD